MDIRQLQYFAEIVNQGSISKAAEVLHIAQPPLSQQLKKLETELGTVLIHRYRQKWELTETGKVLHEYAEKVLSSMKAVRQQIKDIEEGSVGVLRIGVSSACLSLLTAYLGVYRERFPKVRIIVEKGNSDDLLKKLERKEIEVALLLRLEQEGDYEVKTLGREGYVAVSPREWGPVFTTERGSLREVAGRPFIMLGAMEGHSFYDTILQAFDSAGVVPDVVMETKDLTTVLAMVSSGLGMSIIPRVAYSVPMGDLLVHELTDFPYHVEPVMIRTAGEQVSKAADQFWDIVGD